VAFYKRTEKMSEIYSPKRYFDRDFVWAASNSSSDGGGRHLSRGDERDITSVPVENGAELLAVLVNRHRRITKQIGEPFTNNTIEVVEVEEAA
jgi:hypothetical protein